MNVLLVDDSILVRGMVKKLIQSFPDFMVIGEASNGQTAIDLTKQMRPDLILMDINMPTMDGIEATGRIMEEIPTPIIILTSEDIASTGYRAISNGAIEIIPKPDINQLNSDSFRDSLHKVLLEARRYGALKIGGSLSSESSDDTLSWTMPSCKVVAIGASTGGPSAVKTVLSSLPASFPVPLVLSQHIENGYDDGYAQWLDASCELDVRIAKDGDRLQAGTVLVAPADKHLLVNSATVTVDDGPRVGNQKPSVDVMFTSTAKSHKHYCIAVLLTGMGRDGAIGCKEIINAGGKTLVQDQKTSMIFGMPKAAIESGSASEVLALDRIGAELIRRINP